MARYTGPVCRLCRRERMKLFLKGTKCDTMKCPIERRPYPPGDHGRTSTRSRMHNVISLRNWENPECISAHTDRAHARVAGSPGHMPGWRSAR